MRGGNPESLQLPRGLPALESLCNRHGKVGEEHILVLGSRKVGRGATEKGLHLHAPDATLRTVPEDQAINADDALAVSEELELAVGLAGVVELDALADGGPLAGGEGKGATADGSAVGGVALGEWRDVANALVGRELGVGERREIGVELASTVSAPHEAGREARRGARATGAGHRLFRGVATVYREQRGEYMREYMR